MTEMLPLGSNSLLPAADPSISLPLPCGLLSVDTETGGLDPRLNPLLSVSAVATTPDVEEIDGLSLKVLPPEGTLLEVPRAEHCWVPREELPKRELIGYVNVWTREAISPSAVDRRTIPCLIESGAAEINGYVTKATSGSHPWDLQSAWLWHSQSRYPADVDTTLVTLVRSCFRSKPIPVAHNAPFDATFTCVWLRKFYDELGRMPDSSLKCGWLCTMHYLGKYLDIMGMEKKKGARKLATLVKMAGAEHDAPHDALADARATLVGLRWLRQKPGVFA